MDHEVFVPVPAEPLRRVLADPARVARAVPGLQQDAREAPVSGRLKVRFGGTSITYRGTLAVIARDDGSYTLDGDATEARGGGRVRLAGTLRLVAADGGTTLVLSGTVTGGGRLADLDAGVVATAGRRLVHRFAEGLAEDASDGGAGPGGRDAADGGAPPRTQDAPTAPEEPPTASEEPVVGSPADVTPPAAAEPGAPASSEVTPAGPKDAEHAAPAGQEHAHAAADDDGGTEVPAEDEPGLIYEVDNEPPAEAAHARRTMIGRSAEEVDHAPPRGRYAPVPAPTSVAASVTLRWAAPAAALVVASAIVLGRALRRRR